MSAAPDESSRPDGRTASPELAALRSSTRALRLHLAGLPVDYDGGVSGDRFLAGLAFMSTRNRYDCAESMIGAGFGGTVLGAVARSVFVDGLRWLWIGGDPEARRRSLLGDLAEERSRICKTLRLTGSSCGNLPRWLMPLPDIAGLTGESLTWLDALPIPDEQQLLDDYLTNVSAPGGPADVAAARDVLGFGGLRGAVVVLAHAGHGNYLGLQSSLTSDGAPGHDLRPDHEALFMHVAAAGAVATLVGVAAAVPELWPRDVDQGPFVAEALRLAAVVADAARPLHRLATTKPLTGLPKPAHPKPLTGLLEPAAVIPAGNLLPDVLDIAAVAPAAEEFYRVARGLTIDLWEHGDPTLHSVLTFASAHSHLEAVMCTYEQPGSAVIAVFAARMLLEEAARHSWRYQPTTPDEFTARATQYFDEYRQRQKKTIDLLAGNGVPISDARALFTLPGKVKVPDPPVKIQKNREQLPTITAMLAELGGPFPEPGWLQVAYSRLSQITHATPIGLMHSVRHDGHGWAGNELSPEMLGLALDVTCLSSALLIGRSAIVGTGGAQHAVEHSHALVAAAADVHAAGRLVHGLD
jgi:hypothetical protein